VVCVGHILRAHEEWDQCGACREADWEVGGYVTPMGSHWSVLGAPRPYRRPGIHAGGSSGTPRDRGDSPGWQAEEEPRGAGVSTVSSGSALDRPSQAKLFGHVSSVGEATTTTSPCPQSAPYHLVMVLTGALCDASVGTSCGGCRGHEAPAPGAWSHRKRRGLPSD